MIERNKEKADVIKTTSYINMLQQYNYHKTIAILQNSLHGASKFKKMYVVGVNVKLWCVTRHQQHVKVLFGMPQNVDICCFHFLPFSFLSFYFVFFEEGEMQIPGCIMLLQEITTDIMKGPRGHKYLCFETWVFVCIFQRYNFFVNLMFPMEAFCFTESLWITGYRAEISQLQCISELLL